MPKRSKSVWKRLVAVATKWAENGYGLNSLYEFQACHLLWLARPSEITQPWVIPNNIPRDKARRTFG